MLRAWATLFGCAAELRENLGGISSLNNVLATADAHLLGRESVVTSSPTFLPIMELRNHTILITGGSSGLGLEFARQLLALGNTVLITGRDQARLDQAQLLLPQVHAFRSDVSDPAAIAALHAQVVAQFPALNILLNNAGEIRKLNLNDPALTLPDVTQEIDSNLSGPIRMVQQFLPHLKAQKIAAILHVNSGLALAPFPIAPVYGATKAGLRSYTQSLRVQLKPTAVQVFELVGPAANTPLNDRLGDAVDNSQLMEPKDLIAATLTGMQQGQEEIYPGLAKVIRFLSRLAPGFLLKQLSKPVAKEFGGLKPV